jgi:selenocysteine-specific elongation factor
MAWKNERIERGMVLSVPDVLTPTFMLDAYFTLTPKAPKALKHRQRIRFHHGTSEILARVMLFDREELQPGESTYIQIRLESPLVAMARDRFIIRSYSPIMTIGGGEILHVHPKKYKRSAGVPERLHTLKDGTVEEIVNLYVQDARLQPITPKMIAGMIALHEQEIARSLRDLLRLGTVIQTPVQGIAVVHTMHVQQLKTELLEVLTEFHRQFPLKAGMVKEKTAEKIATGSFLTSFSTDPR